MPTSLIDREATVEPRFSPFASSLPRHEANLHKAQAIILDRELALRKIVLAQNEEVIATFERLIPLLAQKSPALSECAEQIRAIARELEKMKERERNATIHPDLPRPTGADAAIVIENARRASANQAYFDLIPIFQTLVTSIKGLFMSLLQIDPGLAATIRPTRDALDASWKKIAPFAGSILTRAINVSPVKPTPEDVRQARVIWQELLRRDPANTYLHSLKPHDGTSGPVRILYFTVGGLGDALLQTACIAELKRRFASCEILVVHSRPVVHALFARNRTVDGTLYVTDDLLCKVPAVAKAIGIFDLVVESRFIVWAELCAGSRVTAEGDLNWVTNSQRSVAAFAPYLERFPHYNNLFARILRPKMLLDVHGMSTGLPVSVDSPLVICPEGVDAEFPAKLGLVEHAYVTVHDGFDEGFGKQMGISRCTKQLPESKWRTIIDDLRRRGLKVVQVGVAGEPELRGVDLDLRGKTTLSQLCFVLKSAAVHIDTEGGIVHVARAVHKRSIVFFGPTSVSFWGYPQNINLCSEEYTDHWWISSDWMARSPVPQKRSAMEAFDVSGIANLAINERDAQVSRRFELLDETVAPRVDISATDGGGRRRLLSVLAHARRTSDSPMRIAVVGHCASDLLLECAELAAHVDVFVLNAKHRIEEPPLSHVVVHLASLYNLPATSDRYDVVICAFRIDSVVKPVAVLNEMTRLVRIGGVLTFALAGESGVDSPEATPVGQTTGGEPLMHHLEQICRRTILSSRSPHETAADSLLVAPASQQRVEDIIVGLTLVRTN